jgi:hypothetical protein
MAKPAPDNLLVPTAFPQTRRSIGAVQVITASDELFNHVDGDLPMWSGDGDRSVTANISFERAFRESPAITLGITGMDCDHSQNQRFGLNAINIKPTGFTIEFTTWGATHIARAGVSWQAIGEAKPNPVEAKDTAMKKAV